MKNLIRQSIFLSEKRDLMPRKDFYINTREPQNDLINLIAMNLQNRMAFEYYMLYALFTHDLSTVAANVKYLDRLHYEKIPIHIEEALVLVMAMNPEFPIDLGKYQISEQTRTRFMGYSKILIAK